MMNARPVFALVSLTIAIAAACGGKETTRTPGAGANAGRAGASSGGTVGSAGAAGRSSGGSNSGGSANAASGGSSASSGTSGEAGETATGGTATGGTTSGGPSTGGSSAGGAPAGGSSAGGLAGEAGATSGGASGETGNAGNGPTCKAFGELCAGGNECCSGTCNPQTDSCESAIVACGDPGAGCSSPTDCCNLNCNGTVCRATACVSDGDSCSGDTECCGGTCGPEDTCEPLNPECKTAGNDCSGDGECCSKSCVNGKCDLAVSWCIQPGDICSRDRDCCTSECVIESGASVGTCGAPPEGPSFCDGVDGMVCDGCNQCCSRLCAPGPSGRTICQPASGCHVTGDLCRRDEDCCGGDEDSGLPGAGNVTCEIEDGKTVGICRNPMSCNPQGNVCHKQDYMCSISSARANCCGALGAMSDGCQLDALGVPRCNGMGVECRDPGETCASADDCCDDLPCVPDVNGVLRCAVIPPGDPPCVMAGGGCSINGDCCPGTTCIRPPGSTVGVCSTDGGTGGTGGQPGTGGGAGNGGTGGTTAGSGGAGTGGTGGTGGSTAGTGGSAGSCASYGQICGSSSDCCNNVPCNGNICRFFTP
jgi:hypothetical protein